MQTIDIKEQGTVLEVKRSIVRITGLPHCLNGQLVDFSGGLKGMIMGFKEKEVLALILSAKQNIRPGEKVYGREELFRIPVGYGFLGRIVNALAEPCDSKGPILANGKELNANYYPAFREAPSVLEREPIHDALETGIRTIDSMIPIGKGQRELIVSDRMIGKSTIAIDTILNQSRNSTPGPGGKRVTCIYCLIGKDYKTLTEIIRILKINAAFEHTILVFALASSSPGEQYLAPYTACTLGEFFMDKGEDVFIAFDDLTKHAWAYRELSLLLERSPGRDAYPGDIFYIHSQLMERAGKLNEESKGGSMTFFPIVETIQGDITGYIPSNLISITDGQIYLNSTLFAEGFKPAIDVGLSVSRIGNKVQSPALKELSGKLRLEYIQYKELLKMSKLKAGLSPEVEAKLKRGQALTQILIQEKNRPSSHEKELIMFYALYKGFLDGLDKEKIKKFKKEIYKFACGRDEQLVKELAEKRELTEGIRQGLDRILEDWLTG